MSTERELGGGADRRSAGAGWLHSWRVAVRIARRDAVRFKGRSLMVLAMIALPIVGVSAADITIRSSHLSQSQQTTRQMGAADALVASAGSGGKPVYQQPVGGGSMQVDELKGGDDAGSAVDSNADPDGEQDPYIDPRPALPPNARWLSDQSVYVPVRTRFGLLDAPLRELKAADPMARGLFDLDRGHFPEAPDELMATNAFLKSSGLHVGSKLRVRGLDRGYRIVGAYDLPSELHSEEINALPGSFIAPFAAARKADGEDAHVEPPTYLVSVPGDFTWEMVMRANTKGVTVESRYVRQHPPANAEVPMYGTSEGASYLDTGGGADRSAELAAAITVVGLSMLEISLLAGPAFAVGARRSRRQLGLVGANGGDRRHIRAIVISSGLVIGVAAAVVGTALGLATTVLLRGTLESYVGKRFGGVTLRPAELLGIGGLAVVTGVLAAVVPAVTASRQSVLASLTGRRGVRRSSRVTPIAGLVLLALGAGLAGYGSLHSDSVYVVAGGAALAEIGLVLMTSAIVGLFGRLGRWLPLAPRLALRDAVRNRGRTAPAVAAVLAAVAGSVAVATFAASQGRQDHDAYQAQLPRGVVSVEAYGDSIDDLASVRAAVAKDLPVSGQVDVSQVYIGGTGCATRSVDGCGDAAPVIPAANRCPSKGADGPVPMSVAQRRALVHDWRCSQDLAPSAISPGSGIMVGGPGVLHALGIRDGAAERALARGETVLFDRAYDDHGTVRIKVTLDASKPVDEGQEPIGPVKSLPAFLAAEHQSYGVLGVMPQQAADAAGFKTAPLGSYFTTSRMPSTAQRQALDSDIAKIGTRVEVYVERGYRSDGSLVLLALTIFAGLVTIGAAGIATGLAQTDAEPDLKTLAAIGAAPRVRRTLSGFQCGVIALMGVLLGSVAGVLPAIGLRHTDRRRQVADYWQQIDQGWSSDATMPHVPIVVPWGTLALLLVAVPVGAALLAALVTRSRPQLARRSEA